MRIRGAVALVTGASSGIGAATARSLAGLGATVVAHGRDADRLTRLARLAGPGGPAGPGAGSSGRIVPLVGDLAVGAGIGGARVLAEAALAAAGRVDILVNNAGAGLAAPFTSVGGDQLAELVAVNLTAPVELTRLLLPGMLGRGEGQVSFVTSIAGRTGVAGEAVYAATKAGLDTFAESLRLELAGTGVRVGVLVPGVVDTAFFDRRGRPYDRRRPRPLPADRVAAALVRAIATGRDERYAPGWLRLPVAVRALLPGTYRRLAGRFGGS
jgi:short-subunit dehydrogenase